MSQIETLQVEREEMEVDVVIVGGGSAGLACAIQMQNQIEAHNSKVDSGEIQGERLEDPMIVVLEKAAEVGAHSLSGAVMNPAAIKELIPDYKEKGFPLISDVEKESFYFFGEKSSFKSPIIPPPFHNSGNHIVSISKVNRWLAEQAEAKGIHIFSGFPAVKVLLDGDKVTGVQTGDRGLDKNGQPKENFEPGMLIKSKMTIFADGTRSPLLKRVAKDLGLREGTNPEVFELGVKEVIQLPEGRVEPGHVIHTMGYPVKKGMGGTFIYTLDNNQIIVGLCMYLDTSDPLLDVHRELQNLKTHPYMQKLLEGGEVVSYGGKTLPAGGWFSMPKLYHHGMMVCGDSASMVDVKKLKGIHLAMKSGMLAAETAVEALVKGDYSEDTLSAYKAKIDNSFVKKELWKTRNFHQALSKGFLASLPEIALQEMTGGRGLFARRGIAHTDAKATKKAKEVWGEKWQDQVTLPETDNKLIFDKLSSVYMAGSLHDEDSPNHLKLGNADICSDQCHPEYNSPCNHFCPASVYEMIEQKGKKQLQINYTNCIHCQTCDLKCPFDNIDWNLPEGGGGPAYKEM